MATTKADLTERAVVAEKANEQLAHHLKEAEELLAKTKEQHQIEVSILSQKKDIQREKALVALERANQEQLTAANEKIRSLYDEIAQLRASYEEQLGNLKQEIEKVKEKKQEKNNE